MDKIKLYMATRPCKYLKIDGDTKLMTWEDGEFHQWSHTSEHPEAIVVDIYGKVHIVSPEDIQFMDMIGSYGGLDET